MHCRHSSPRRHMGFLSPEPFTAVAQGAELKTPKVLVVMRSGSWRGGAEWMLWHLFEESRIRNVHWIAVFLEDGDLAKDVSDIGIETHVIPAGRMREPYRG